MKDPWRVAIYCGEDFKRKIKAECALRGMPLSDAFIQALEEWSKQGGKAKAL